MQISRSTFILFKLICVLACSLTTPLFAYSEEGQAERANKPVKLEGHKVIEAFQAAEAAEQNAQAERSVDTQDEGIKAQADQMIEVPSQAEADQIEDTDQMTEVPSPEDTDQMIEVPSQAEADQVTEADQMIEVPSPAEEVFETATEQITPEENSEAFIPRIAEDAPLEEMLTTTSQFSKWLSKSRRFISRLSLRGSHVISESSYYVGAFENLNSIQLSYNRLNVPETKDFFFNSSYRISSALLNFSLNLAYPLKKEIPTPGVYNIKDVRISYHYPLFSILQLMTGISSPIKPNIYQDNHILSLYSGISYQVQWDQCLVLASCTLNISHIASSHFYTSLAKDRTNSPTSVDLINSISFQVRTIYGSIIPSVKHYISRSYFIAQSQNIRFNIKAQYTFTKLHLNLFTSYSWISNSNIPIAQFYHTDYFNKGFLIGLSWYV